MKTVELIDKVAVLEAAKKLDSYAWSDFASLVEGQPVIRLPEDALPEPPDFYMTDSVLAQDALQRRRLIDAAELKRKVLDAGGLSNFARTVVFNLIDATEAADRDCIDLICEQILKILRHESDDGDRYAIQLRDGKWVFTGMNEIVRRFIFDNRHCKQTQVSITGETEYLRGE